MEDIRNLSFNEKIKHIETTVEQSLKTNYCTVVHLNDDESSILFTKVGEKYLAIPTLSKIDNSNMNMLQEAYAIANNRLSVKSGYEYQTLHEAVETVLTLLDQLGYIHNEEDNEWEK